MPDSPQQNGLLSRCLHARRRCKPALLQGCRYERKLRPLEREDLHFVHQLDNNASVMRYWFEEPYEAFVELSDLYNKHIHDQSERRFVVENDGEKVGPWNW